MTWTYNQSSGKLYDPDGNLAGTGYAGGNGGNDPIGVNNHAMQNVRNVGPIPVGTYTLGTVVMQSQLGPFAIPLMPDASNEMYGRSGFFCHGDKANPPRSASHGCIIMARAVRDKLYASTDRRICVVNIKEV